MRVATIVCDRCTGRIWQEQGSSAYALSMVATVTVQQGDRTVAKDLCPSCLHVVEMALLPSETARLALVRRA